jgi:hypothetical protein
VSLYETIRAYTQTLRKIESMSSVSTLISGFRVEVQNLIAKGTQHIAFLISRNANEMGVFRSLLRSASPTRSISREWN